MKSLETNGAGGESNIERIAGEVSPKCTSPEKGKKSVCYIAGNGDLPCAHYHDLKNQYSSKRIQNK